MTESSAPEGEMSPLKPCPFCGGEAEIINYSVHCNNPFCEAQPFTAGQHVSEAIAAWNRREYAATSAAQAASGGAWQPIETAPKDGSMVIVFRPLAHVTHDLNVDIKRSIDRDNGCWDATVPKGCEKRNFTDGACFPTHWMPLPKPPAAPDHPSPSREGPSDAEMLTFLLAHCKVVYYPTGSGYPVEHNPFALGYPKDGAFLLGALRAAMKEHQP